MKPIQLKDRRKVFASSVSFKRIGSGNVGMSDEDEDDVENSGAVSANTSNTNGGSNGKGTGNGIRSTQDGYMSMHICLLVLVVVASFMLGVFAAFTFTKIATDFNSDYVKSESIQEYIYDSGKSSTTIKTATDIATTSSEKILTINNNIRNNFNEYRCRNMYSPRHEKKYGVGAPLASAEDGSTQQVDPKILVLNHESIDIVNVSKLDLKPKSNLNRQNGDSLDVESCPTGSQSIPDSQIKLLIAITSTCCSVGSMRKRDAIRDTWLKDGRLKFDDILNIKFFLSMPETDNEEEKEEYRRLIREEMAMNQDDNIDMVILNDAIEKYENLPSKTIEIMRYMKMSSCQYTHVLKTDDDVYVRVAGIVSMIGYQGAGWHVPSEILSSEKMSAVYTGFIELKAGFTPVRDKKSKWYLSEQEWPSQTRRLQYIAGWGYVLSRELGEYVVNRMDYYQSIVHAPERASHGDLPKYFGGMLKLEDVMVGYLLDEIKVKPKITYAFKPAWLGCNNYTILKHMDIDAPFLMPIMSIQDRSGLWRDRTIQCNSGTFLTGSYSKWEEHSRTTKPERVSQIEDNNTIVYDIDYQLYPVRILD